MKVFIPITKVDATKREVWGVAAEEAPDKSGEIMDYAASKPFFEEWSQSIAKATNGASLGNVRAMHQPIAAGKLVDLQFDDAAKKVLVGARIVDDNEWRKVQEGVYTGFSVGGKYGWQKYDATLGKTRYEARPAEISIVDNPAMHGATFTMVKEGGATELVKFVGEPANEALTKVAGDLETLAKAGARHSSADMHLLQSIHDSACSLGAACAEASDAAKAAGNGELKKDADEASWMAWSAGQAVGDISSALAFVAGLSASMTISDPGTATKLQTAAQLLTAALNDQVAKQGAATQAAIADMKADEALEEQVEATTEQVEGADAAATDAAKAEGADGTASTDGTEDEALTEEDMNKAIDAAVEAKLEKFSEGLIATVKSILATGVEPLAKLGGAGDLAKRFDAIEAGIGALTDRLVKVEQRPVSGPVLREINPGAQGGDDARAAALDDLIKNEKDPTVRTALMQQRAQLDIRSVHASGGRRIG